MAGSSEIPSDRPTSPTEMSGEQPTNVMSDQTPTIHSTADTTTNDIMLSSMTPMHTKPMTPVLQSDEQYTPQSPTTFSSGPTNMAPTTNMYLTPTNENSKPPPTMQTDRYPSSSSSGGYGTSTGYGNSGGYGTSGGYGGTQNTDLTYTNEVKHPTHPTMYDSPSKPDSNSNYPYPYPPHYPNKYNYYQDIYPMYAHPMLYDTSYSMNAYNSMPSSEPGYAQNVPSINYPPTIDYYSGSSSSSSSMSSGGGTSVMSTPSMTTYTGGMSTMNANAGSTYMGNGWSNADEVNRRKQQSYPGRLPTTSSSMPANTVYGENSGPYPEGKYNGTRTVLPATVPYIRTYFNPDDYLTNARSEY